jgi:F-type H+-transporting ATPase subunit a
MNPLQPALPPISIKAETIFYIGGFGVTNSMIYTLIVMFGLVLFFWLATRKMSLVPKGAQNVAEVIVEFLLGLVEGTAGKRVGRRIFPLIATLFIFILFANWAGLLPGVGTIGKCIKEENTNPESALIVKTASLPSAPALQEAPKSGGLPTPTDIGACPAGYTFIPFFRAANADLNTTLAMALIAMFTVWASGIVAHGLGGFLKELLTPIPLAPIHIMGELARIISLSFRLFGNIFGGEVLVTVMYVLLGSVFLGFGTFIFLGLEVLFGFIQAMIFSILTLVFIATAVAGHGGGHREEAHAAAGSVEALGISMAGKITGQGGGPVGEPKSSTERHLGA